MAQKVLPLTGWESVDHPYDVSLTPGLFIVNPF